MRVLVFSWHNYWSYGGVQSFTRDLCRPSGDQDGPVRFVPATPKLLGAAVAAMNGRYPPERLRSELVALLTSEGFAAIHSHNSHFESRLPLVALLEDAAAAAGVLHLLTIHDIVEDPSMVSTLQALKRTRFVTQSEFNRAKIARIAGIDAHVLPTGIDFERFPPQSMPSTRTVTCPGRLSPDKGILEALLGIGRLSEQLGVIEVVLSDALTPGTGQTPEYLSELAAAAKAFPKLRVKCLDPEEPLEQLYARAAVGVLLPQVDEGFGLTALECLASGRPVVVLLNGGMVEWLTGLPGVKTVSDNRPGTVASAVAEVLSDPARWHAGALAARQALQLRYDIAAVIAAHGRFVLSMREHLDQTSGPL